MTSPPKSPTNDPPALRNEDTAELDRSLVIGIGWTAAARWTSQLISWSATLYAVRTLAPSDYGLLAMAMIPIGLARMVEDFGLDAVLVQDRSLTGEPLARLAGFAVFLGVSLALVFTAASPLFAAFFKQPELIATVSTLSLLFVIEALQIVPRALLQRALRFQSLALLHIVQTAAGAIALVSFVALGFGYWALILNTVCGSLCATAVVLKLAPIEIAWPRHVPSITAPLISGWRILVSRGAWYGYSNLDSTFIGRVLGKEQLGAYALATTVAKLLIEEITLLVSRVAPGVFSTVQDQPALLRRYFLLLTEAVSYVALPIAVGTALTADYFVPIVLGPQWQQVVGPLRLLCAYWVSFAAQVCVSHVLLWTGHFRATMWLNCLSLVVLPIGFMIGLRWGLEGVAAAWAIGFPLATLPSCMIAWRIMHLSWREFAIVLLPATIASLAMSAVVLTLRHSLQNELSDVAMFVLLVGSGAAAYTLVMLAGFRERVLAIVAVIRAVRRNPT